jgi:hypothetical protein
MPSFFSVVEGDVTGGPAVEVGRGGGPGAAARRSAERSMKLVKYSCERSKPPVASEAVPQLQIVIASGVGTLIRGRH